MTPGEIGTAFDNWGWWVASRASGVAALVLVTISVGLGLMMASKLMRRPGFSRVMTALHEQTALAGMFAISVHAITLIGDPWLKPGVVGVLVPFVMDYRPFFTGLGVIAGLLALFLGLTFYARKDVGSKFWRKIHRATVLVYALAVIHTIGAGTDASAVWMKWWLIITTPVIVGLFLLRVGTAIRKARRKVQPRPGAGEPASPATTPASDPA